MKKSKPALTAILGISLSFVAVACKQENAAQKNFEAERGLFRKEKSAIRFVPPELSSDDATQPFVKMRMTNSGEVGDYQACAYRTRGSSVDVKNGERLSPNPIFFSEVAKGIAGDRELFHILDPWQSRVTDTMSSTSGLIVAGVTITFAGVGLCAMLTHGACIPALATWMNSSVGSGATKSAANQIAKSAAGGDRLFKFLLATLFTTTSVTVATTSASDYKNVLSDFRHRAMNNREAKALMDGMAEERKKAKKVSWSQLDGIAKVIQSSTGNIDVRCKEPGALDADLVAAYLQGEEELASGTKARTEASQ